MTFSFAILCLKKYFSFSYALSDQASNGSLPSNVQPFRFAQEFLEKKEQKPLVLKITWKLPPSGEQQSNDRKKKRIV